MYFTGVWLLLLNITTMPYACYNVSSFFVFLSTLCLTESAIMNEVVTYDNKFELFFTISLNFCFWKQISHFVYECYLISVIVDSSNEASCILGWWITKLT